MRIYFIFLLLALISCKESTPSCDEIKQSLHYSSEVDDSITVKLSWITKPFSNDYAPQYRIDSLLYSDYLDHNYYYNKELVVKCLDKELEEHINKIEETKSDSTHIVLSGVLRRNGMGILRLDARCVQAKTG